MKWNRFDKRQQSEQLQHGGEMIRMIQRVSAGRTALSFDKMDMWEMGANNCAVGERNGSVVGQQGEVGMWATQYSVQARWRL